VWLLVKDPEGEHSAVELNSAEGRGEYGPITTSKSSSFTLERDEYGKIGTHGRPSITGGPSGEHEVVAVGREAPDGIRFETLAQPLPEDFFGEFTVHSVINDLEAVDVDVLVREIVRIEAEEPTTLLISRTREDVQ
jgi:hypothetical protein